jgi:hypothetical protein
MYGTELSTRIVPNKKKGSANAKHKGSDAEAETPCSRGEERALIPESGTGGAEKTTKKGIKDDRGSHSDT